MRYFRKIEKPIWPIHDERLKRCTSKEANNNAGYHRESLSDATTMMYIASATLMDLCSRFLLGSLINAEKFQVVKFQCNEAFMISHSVNLIKTAFCSSSIIQLSYGYPAFSILRENE